MISYNKYILSIIFIFTLFTVEISNAQNQNIIDSLEQKLEYTKDSSKIDILINLCWNLRNSEFQKSIKYGLQTIELAQQYKDIENLTKAHSFVGVAYRNLGNYTEAFNFYFNGLKLATENNLTEQEGYANINIGNLFVYQEKYTEASKYLNKALIISKKINNKEMLAYSHLNIGRVLIKENNCSQALLHLDSTLTIRKKIKDYSALAVCYKYIGDTYIEMDNFSSALKNYKNTLQIIENSADKDLLCDVYNKIAEIYLSNSNIEKAKYYAKKSLQTALEIGTKLRIRNAYISLAQIEKYNKNYKAIANYNDFIIKYNDSLFNQQLAEKIFYIEFISKQHEYEQKLKNQELLHNTSIQRQKQYRSFSIILTIVLIIISVIIFMFFRSKQKANKILLNKNKQIQKQKSKLEDILSELNKSSSKIEQVNKNLIEERNIFIKGNIVTYNFKNKEELPAQYISPNAFDVFGYTAKEFISEDVLYKDIIYLGDVERVIKEAEDANKSNIPYFKHNDYRVIHKNGGIIWVSDFSTIIKNKAGKVTNHLGYIQDITKRKKAERETEKSKLEAEQANLLKSEFLANMSHEIRTPINAVLGFSEILDNKLSTKPEYKHLINGIIKGGKNLILLINDILDLSKIEAGYLEIKSEPVNLRKLIDDIKQLFIVRIRNKKLQFKIDIDEKLPTVIMLDQTRIRQILFNLVGNAIKFTESGFVCITVKTKYINKPKNKIDLYIKIKDTGIGIQYDQISRIFEAFRQSTGQSSKYGGTGLGLSITKRLVEAMNGNIVVESKVGKGSTFSIYLNKIIIPNKTTLSKSKNQDHQINNIKFSKPIILFVDDIESNREVIKYTLENYNCIIHEEENGKDAIEYLKNHTPDLILMDIQMPGINGYETTIKIKEQSQLANIPIIALTALAMREQEEKYGDIFNDYLKKPVNTNKLLQSITKFLPYTKINKNSNSNSETKNYIKEFDTYIKNNGGLSKAFIKKYKKEILPIYKEVKDILDIEDCKTFASKLIELGKEFNIGIIEQFGTELLTVIENFQISEIEELLTTFSKINFDQ